MNAENIAVDFLRRSRLFEGPSSILINPLITETNAAPGHGRSFQPNAVVQYKDTTWFVTVIRSSESTDMDIAENLRCVERILFGPYQINIPVHAVSGIILIFESSALQTAFGQFLTEQEYAFEFPLFLTNSIDYKITQYPKEKGFFRRFIDRLCNLSRCAFES